MALKEIRDQGLYRQQYDHPPPVLNGHRPWWICEIRKNNVDMPWRVN
jgi:hypothetical protein